MYNHRLISACRDSILLEKYIMKEHKTSISQTWDLIHLRLTIVCG